MVTKLTREALFEETEKTLQAITSEAFLERMSEFRETDTGQRSDFAKEFMTPDALIDKGAPIPIDMRLSSRVFDDSPNLDLVVDYDGGKSVLAAMLKEKPNSLVELKDKAPNVYEDLVKDYLPKGLTLHPEITPDDPGFTIPLGPDIIKPYDPEHETPKKPVLVPGFDPDIDPYSVNGCAGGGGLTFCGCAGGGT
jgi:hypothetical protein